MTTTSTVRLAPPHRTVTTEVNELTHVPRPTPPALSPQAQLVVDTAVGVVGVTVGTGLAVTRTAARLASPVARLAWRPALLPTRFQPATMVTAVAGLGQAERELLARRVGELLDAWVPVVAEVALGRLDLTRIVRENVRLDEVVADVDLDSAVARVDLSPIVERVDIDAILDRVDLDAVVARVDIEAILDRVDVDTVVGRADLDAVIARIDIVGMVEEVIEAIDLPAIIRESTGSMASETMRGVRMSGINADDALTRVVERGFLRRRPRPAPTTEDRE